MTQATQRPKGLFKRVKSTLNLTADVIDITLASTATIVGDTFGTLSNASGVAKGVADDSLTLWRKESKVEFLQDDMELEYELRKSTVAFNARMAELDKEFKESAKPARKTRAKATKTTTTA